MSADLYFPGFFFVRRLISELAERNSTKIGHTLGSNCDLKMHVQNLGYPLPLQIGGPKRPFWTTSQLNGNLKVYIFGTKHDIDNRSSELTTTKGLLRRPKCHELWSTNGFKLGVSYFHQPSVKSAFQFIARLRRRRSANETQPHFAKRWMVGRANNLS